MRSFVFTPLAVAVCTVLTALPVAADTIQGDGFLIPALEGNIETSIWKDLSIGGVGSGYGSFPGAGPWTATGGVINSQAGGGNATLQKGTNGTGGGPYVASGSIYFGGFSGDINNDGGVLRVVDSTPLAGLQQAVFQVQIGEAWTHDFWNDQLPQLIVNNDTVNPISATDWAKIDQIYNGTIEMPSGLEDLYTNTYALEWDLSGYADPITSLEVAFNGVQHAQVYGLRLDQADVYKSLNLNGPAAIPEPGSLILLGSGLLFGVPMEIRRRRKATPVTGEIAS